MEEIGIPVDLEVHPLGDNGEMEVLPSSNKNILSPSMEEIGIPVDLEVHPLGDNGEMEVLPSSNKNILSPSQLPCGLPPVLTDTKAMLNSFLENLDQLPILQLDAVQIPIEPNISSLYSINLCPLQTHLSVKRNMISGKLLGFCEEEKDIFEGTHKTSTSLSRAPGPPEAGVKGSTSSFPFWPGGMDEPWADLLKKESLNKSLFEGDLLDTPPGFKCGMKFEIKSQDEMDYMRAQPQKIYLSEVLSMDDTLDLEILNEIEETKEEVNLEKDETEKQPEPIGTQDDVLKLTSLPVLNISETTPKAPAPKYEWAVIEDVKCDVEDFYERIPNMAYNWNFELDIFQKRAILHLEKKESVFVAAHTSAGKTVVAEYAVALAKKNVTRVIYTSPIKALSNQKFREFKKSFEDVGLITGDVQINPTAFCLIMTTEILRSMLYHGSDVIRELEWVIFDEVHYINDAERGVVWEEVFIMLPDHVNLIMLSATVPNTADFAEWLGGIKKRKIYVIKTLKRPVPLIYHLYTGSVGKNEKNMFKIVDISGKFLDDKYMEACRSKEKKDTKSKSTGPKGPKYIITLAQEKNVYIGLLEHLQKNDLLPAVCFTFSRKKCNEHAEMLTSQNLVTKEERNRIHKFFHQSITQLKKEDQQLPQIKLMEEQLERGFGVHHSGILPILKEIVELLFQDGLVKVLFATETFAMGVNMPARTVVFDSIRKHDGLNFRYLEPSEFIQMAGRAGRRGLDKEGIVIVLCKADVPDPISLRNMMLGQPTKLQSQFKLTYSMILNLLKIKTFRVEDVMKRSFGESDNQKQQKNYQALLHDATNKLNSVSELDCSICNIDINKYIQEVKEATNLREEVMEKKCSQVANKLFTPGRVLVISNSQHQNVLGTLLDVDKENKCKVLVITGKKTLENGQNSTSKDSLCPWTNKLFYPNEKQPEVLTITFKEVSVIGNKVLRIDEKDILKQWSRMKIQNSNPSYSISSAFQELCSVCEANLNGLPSANINLKDLTLKDVGNFVGKLRRLETLESSLQDFKCVNCPDFSKHFSEQLAVLELKEEIKKYKHKLSEESLSLHPEYQMRKNVLKSLEYIDQEENVQLKGCVAREMSNHELLITELLVKSVFGDCKPEDVAALLSCMVFQQRCDDSNLELPVHLAKKVKEIKEVAMLISEEQERNCINEPYFVDQYNFYLVNVVYEWARGTPFAEIMQKTDVDEGIIVRSIQRLNELLKDVRNGASLVGDTVLAQKMEEASHRIKRNIVFACSLYTQ